MNNKEFVAELSRRTGRKSDSTQRLLQNVLNAMGDSFMEGDSVQISNFGSFEVKKKLERIMVNPTTGQRMLVPPKMVLGFKPHTSWKMQIKGGGEE
jgi:DNA-binding protein HU-beta/integration host factor subunit alpha